MRAPVGMRRPELSAACPVMGRTRRMDSHVRQQRSRIFVYIDRQAFRAGRIEEPFVDILVNNAGMSPAMPSSLATSEEVFTTGAHIRVDGGRVS